MKKAMFVVVMLVVLALPGIGHSQERSGNETLPEYKVWLPVVEMPSLEEMYPKCPYRTTLVSPEDGASSPQVGATFVWQNTAPMSHLRLVSQSEAYEGMVQEFTTTDNRYGVSKPALPVLWRVRAMCNTSDGVFYGPWSEERILYWGP